LHLLARWRKRPPAAVCDPNEQLAHFRVLYEEGQVSLAEYERIRSVLSEQIRPKLAAPALSPTPAGAPVAGTATAPLSNVPAAPSAPGEQAVPTTEAPAVGERKDGNS